MTALMLHKLRYPDWFDIRKKDTDTEDEEKYVELREEILSFLKTLLSKDLFVDGLFSNIDQRIHSLMNQDPSNLDIRELDIVFTMLNVIM
jgi:hypothetical protein